MIKDHKILIDKYKSAVTELKILNENSVSKNETENIFVRNAKYAIQKYVFVLAIQSAYIKEPQLDKDVLKLLLSNIEYFNIGTEFYVSLYVNNELFATGSSYNSFDEAFNNAAENGIKYLNAYPVECIKLIIESKNSI